MTAVITRAGPSPPPLLPNSGAIMSSPNMPASSRLKPGIRRPVLRDMGMACGQSGRRSSASYQRVTRASCHLVPRLERS